MLSLNNGYKWVVGDGEDICAIRYQWLRGKQDFRVENDYRYAGITERVSDYIDSSTKRWNVALVTENFLLADAKSILSIPIPRRDVKDKVVWAWSTTGLYTAKDRDRYWLNQNNSITNVSQCQGWRKLWSPFVPHKIKIFIWRLCRNTVSVPSRISAKGIRLPITCPMCSVDIEHLLHVFFDCQFAKQ